VTRAYRLGRRQPSVDRTARSILDAARELLAAGGPAASGVAAIARRAGVSRITVYNRFGSRAGVLRALAPVRPTPRPQLQDAREALRAHLSDSVAAWAADPALYRHLSPTAGDADEIRRLAERLATSDALRPGCSLREAEDVIGLLSSFAVFDRLHRDGRRPAAAVADVLMRMASAILV
jgi:AcrR family transcriptional regulator